MTQARPSRGELAALLAILLAAASIRFATADYSLWFDELASLAFADQPLAHLWSGWMIRESNPPLYYTLLRGWIALFGERDLAVRALSIVIGLIGIAAAWALARRLGGTFAGLSAAVLLAVLAANIAFSQEVRGYALAHTATLLALLGVAGFLETRRLLWLGLYGAAALTALYAHTTMAIFVGLTGIAVLWTTRRDRKGAAAWCAANVVVAAGWMWWAAISLQQAQAPQGTFGWIPAPGFAGALRIVEQTYLPDYLGQMGLAGGVLLFVMLGWLARFAWNDRRAIVVVLAILVFGAPIALVAASSVQPILLVRTLYWASAPLIVLVALALGALAPAWRIPLLAAMIAFEAAMLVHWLPARQLESWPEAIAAIDRTAPEGIILVDGDAMAVAAARYLPERSDLRLLALDRPPGGSNHWADGLYAGPHVDAAGASALLHREHRIFALTIGDQNPARVLGGEGRGRLALAASRGQQPLVWIWSDESDVRNREGNGLHPHRLRMEPAHAALSMPSSPNLR